MCIRDSNISGQTGGFTVSGNAVINGTNLVENLFGRENVELTPVSNTCLLYTSYQALGRLMTTMDEQLDMIINKMGMVGR